MRRTVFMIVLVSLSLLLLGFTSWDVPASRGAGGIIWQSYSLDDLGTWRLESFGQNFTQTHDPLSESSRGLISGPSMIELHGRIPEQGLSLSLDANITVGATWDLMNDQGLSSVEMVDYKPYSDLSGAPGRMVLRISSNSTDSQAVSLIYHRPWLTDELVIKKLVISTSIFPQSLDLSHESEMGSQGISVLPDIQYPDNKFTGSLAPSVLPADFDWRNKDGINYVTPIRDQELCGSCWAHAIIAATESALLIDGIDFDRNTLDLSEQYLVSCRTGAVDSVCGGFNSSANDYHLDRWGQFYNPPGAVLESAFPYVGDSVSCGFGSVAHPYKIASYTYVGDGMTWTPHDANPTVKRANIELIKSAIYAHGPVGAGIFAEINWCYPSWSPPSSCHPYVEDPYATVNHDILIVGWHDDGDLDFTDDYWIVKNSFGEGFNDAGYVNVSFDSSVIGTGAYYVDFNAGQYRGDADQKSYIPLVQKPISPPIGTWVTLLDENFEGSFPKTGWTVNNGGATVPFYWGQSACRATTPGGHSLWWLGAGGMTPSCDSNYPEGINASAYYGPIDLSDATAAFVKYRLWANSWPTYEYVYYDPDYPSFGGYSTADFLLFGAGFGDGPGSISVTYPGEIYGNSVGWREMFIDLSRADSSGYPEVNMLGRNNVYIYFGAISHDYVYVSPDLPEGFFIDDVVVKKCVGGTCSLDW